MSEKFPFSLDNIVSWILRMKDGTVVRYNLVTAESQSKSTTKSSSTTWYPAKSSWSSYKDWCSHDPDPSTTPALFEKDGLSIWIADAAGARKVASLFDVAIDGGNVLNVPGEHDLPYLYGDPKLKNSLSKHTHAAGYAKEDVSTGVKILKIRWADRCAPPVFTSFWPALLDDLLVLKKKNGGKLNVLTICQGGHGRSGSAAALLIMNLTDYSPLDALTHVRALHCARAIESKEQHQYLNMMAHALDRPENALDAEGIPSFKQRFLDSDSPWMAPYKDRLLAGKGAVQETREGNYL